MENAFRLLHRFEEATIQHLEFVCCWSPHVYIDVHLCLCVRVLACAQLSVYLYVCAYVIMMVSIANHLYDCC